MIVAHFMIDIVDGPLIQKYGHDNWPKNCLVGLCVCVFESLCTDIAAYFVFALHSIFLLMSLENLLYTFKYGTHTHDLSSYAVNSVPFFCKCVFFCVVAAV